MVTIIQEEEEDDEEQQQTTNPIHHQPPPDSPDSVSSISSDHTFHGFSPIQDNPPSQTQQQQLEPFPIIPSISSVSNRLIRDQPESVIKTESNAVTGFTSDSGERGGGGGGFCPPSEELKGAKRLKFAKRLGLGFRVFEVVVCLISFSVMASDKHRGWALDSFDRYVEFRYPLSVNIIGFAYSGLQGFDLLLQLATGKDILQNQLHYRFDFALDQILAYLLLSASSSAYFRVNDWISNWGQDKFPSVAGASIAVSFLAFIAFAFSSLISGYILCTHR